ncbi:nudix hydrolase 2-like [Nymphaea colorata]|nr:nudix hydrolase 2-like [Nymphaea colorata]
MRKFMVAISATVEACSVRTHFASSSSSCIGPLKRGILSPAVLSNASPAAFPRSLILRRKIAPASPLLPASRFFRDFVVRASNCFEVRRMSILASLPVDVEILSGVDDKYDGVTVEIKEPVDVTAFAASLKASISKWRLQGKKGVWLKIPIQLAKLVPSAVEEGFWYHHAEPTYLMLVHWLPDTPHTLPINATHRVGIGAIVINSERQMLVVQEKTGFFKGTGVWKIPTGVIDEGEDIISGAIREVKEETGIETEFLEILTFRQIHKSFFEKSDLFFVCMLRPLSFEIQKQELEIEDAQWMPLEEYASQPFVMQHEMLKKVSDIIFAKAANGYAGFTPEFGHHSGRSCYLYLNGRDLTM